MLSADIIATIKKSSSFLNLANQDITDVDIPELLKWLEKLPHITGLDLTNNHISAPGAELLATTTTLKELRLKKGNPLGPEDLRPFLDNGIISVFPIQGGSGKLITQLREHFKDNAKKPFPPKKQKEISAPPASTATSFPVPKSLKSAASKKEAVDQDWYTDDKINFLLQNYFTTHFNLNLVYLSAILGTDIIYETGERGNILAAQLQAFHQNNVHWWTANKTIMIPTNVNNNHWVLIIIRQNENNTPTIYYLDPLGGKTHPEVRVVLENQYPITEIFRLKKSLQNDTFNCGAWLIELAKGFVEDNLPGPDFDISAARAAHTLICAPLLAQADLLREKSTVNNTVEQKKNDAPMVNFSFPLSNKKNEYLLLDPIIGTYIIGCPAVKSSGDVYHVLAYLLLAQRLQFEKLPPVILAYDSDDTKEQSQRAKGLLDLLGFEKNVYLQNLPTTSSQPRSRIANVRKHVSQKKTPHNLIDQKATTALFARAVQGEKFQAATTLVREMILIHSQQARKNYAVAMQEIDGWVQAEKSRILKAFTHQKFVLINHRVATGANKEHNIDSQALTLIKNTLQENNICYWYLNTKLTSATNTAHTTHLFDANKTSWDENGLHKLRHILLLIALREIPHLIGVVGNTSGTLDIAAFIGMNVYCFHNFENTSGALYVDAQDYRILLQHWFLTVGMLISTNKNQRGDHNGAFFSHWLLSHMTFPAPLPNLTDRVIGIFSNAEENARHADRIPFSGSLTWPCADKDNRELPPALAVNTNPRLITYSWFAQQDRTLSEDLQTAQKTKGRLRHS